MKREPTHRFHFTVRSIERLSLPKAGRIHHYDAQVPNLGLRVEGSGRKSFFWYKKVNGKPEFRALGVFPATTVDQARGAAHKWSAERDQYKRNKFEGPSPFEKPRASLTFMELVDDYIQRHLLSHAKRPEKAEKGVRWCVDAYLAAWKTKKLAAISRHDVTSLHADLSAERGNTTANRVVQLLRALFNHAIDTDAFTGINPAVRIKMNHEEPRQRFLDGNELRGLFAALRDEPSKDLVDFVNLSLWTGARRGDVLSLRWQDVSLDDNCWRIPDPKSRVPYTVPLTPEAIAILKSRRNESVWVFPGVGKTGHLVDLKRPWKVLLERAAIANLRQHDLRRTLGSWQAAQGTSLQIIGKSLGHSSVQATQVYARLNLDPVRASVTAATKAMIAASKKKPARALKGGKRNG